MSHYDSLLRGARPGIAPVIRSRMAMHKTRALATAFLLFLTIPGWAEAQPAVSAMPTVPASAAHLPLKPNPAFSHYPEYRGTLGGKRIVLRIGVKPDDPEGLDGEYQYLPNGPVVLIAGGRDDKTLTLEESDDGTEISGQWVAFFGDDGALSGQRMNDDQSDPQPVDLKPFGKMLQSIPSASAVPRPQTDTQSGRAAKPPANM